MAAEPSCPDPLARRLANHRPVCRLLKEGELKSRLGNADVLYRLYRWVSSRKPAPGPLYDVPPYNQVALTLGGSGQGDHVFWSGHYWIGMAWFETPSIVSNKRYGEMLIVPGRYTGTGSYVDDHVFLPDATGGWKRINGGQMNQETGDGWARQLRAYLPDGHYIAKGIRLDYTTLTGESAVWRTDDPNCCPSGGRIAFTLQLTASGTFEVADAHYTPAKSRR